VILSDTFEQFAAAVAPKLGSPVILCHRLEVDDATDRITGYRLRMPDQKRAAVEAFQSLAYRVVAAGDSYNDTSMLLAADAGYLFHAPSNVVAEFSQLEAIDDFDTLLARLATPA
jgi:phosphoserine/homoserine phosphotransferase